MKSILKKMVKLVFVLFAILAVYTVSICLGGTKTTKLVVDLILLAVGVVTVVAIMIVTIIERKIERDSVMLAIFCIIFIIFVIAELHKMEILYFCTGSIITIWLLTEMLSFIMITVFPENGFSKKVNGFLGK